MWSAPLDLTRRFISSPGAVRAHSSSRAQSFKQVSCGSTLLALSTRLLLSSAEHRRPYHHSRCGRYYTRSTLARKSCERPEFPPRFSAVTAEGSHWFP